MKNKDPFRDRVDPEKETAFRFDMEHLINKYSIDKALSTPDCVLADFVIQSLKAYTTTKEIRNLRYGENNE